MSTPIDANQQQAQNTNLIRPDGDAWTMAERAENANDAPPDYPSVPKMAYQPNEVTTAEAQAVMEAGPKLVTPLSSLRDQPAEVDCPGCKSVAKTYVAKNDAEGSGLTMCLICLVCWPLLCCYSPEQDIDQYCSKCRRHLVHWPHGGQPTVVAHTSDPKQLVPSRFEQS